MTVCDAEFGQRKRDAKPVLQGLFVTGMVIFFAYLTTSTFPEFRSPTPLLLLGVAYTAYVAGTGPALVAAGMVLIYGAFYFSHTTWFKYDTDGAFKLMLLAAVAPGLAALVGLLKLRSDRMTARAIERERDYSASLLESMQDGLVAHDSDGSIVEVNGSFCRLTGYSREELMGRRPPYPFWAPDDLDDNWAAYRRYMAGEKAEFDVVFARKTGERFPVLLSSSTVPIAGPGGPLRMKTVKDMTDRKRADDTLRGRAAELAMIARTLKRTNEELDQFAYIASHDLKAPLRGIANLSVWIEEDMGDKFTPDAARQMELLRGRVHRMEALIDGILEYSRVSRVTGTVETVDLAMLLADVIDLIDPPQDFVFDVQPEMPTIQTERLRLQQVFMNLISNAIKHHDRPAGRVDVRFRDAGEMVEFSVRDDGPGIAPEYHDKIFVIFQTLTPRDTRESTGVGLSLVKKIVEHFGGTIRVESSLGNGSTFIFTWPKNLEREK